MEKKAINNILKYSTILVVITLILTSFSAIGKIENQNKCSSIFYEIDFKKPIINNEKIGEKIYNTVEMKDTDSYGDIGEPILPVKEIALLLPYKTKVKKINVKTDEKILLESNVVIIPGAKPVSLSKINKISFPEKKASIYNSDTLFPGVKYSNIGVQSFRGYKILYLVLHPVQYNPSKGDIYFYENMKVYIETEEHKDEDSLFRGLKNDKKEVINKIVNPEISNSYICGNKNEKLSDLLIITTDFLKKGFSSLAEIHNNTGINTTIKTLSDIGSDDPEDIRSFIKDMYQNNGIDYVLLGGDYDIVPAIDLWVMAYIGGPTDDMPSDLYYACLDGIYNYDGDDKWGEPLDGSDRSEVDLVAEVFVGRACVGDRYEVDNFVYKTVSYIYNKDSYQNNVLQLGEYLWGPPDMPYETWGGDYMDELIDSSDVNNYHTTGIPSDSYNIERLYDRDYTDNNWPKFEIIKKINQNIHIINHLGHSWYDYNMKIRNEDVNSINNNRFCFIYSQGCDAGGFDDPFGYDCIAEYLTVKNPYGAFAGIWNARAGFGSGVGTDGSSQRFHREFWDAIFAEDIIEISRANQDSKEDNLYRIKQSCMRWCYYQLNLFGDPTIDFFNHYNNNPPDDINRPSGKSNGEVGVEYTFNVEGISDPDGDDLYYQFDYGDDTYSEWIGPFSSDTNMISNSHIWKYPGEYNIKVKARDSYWAVTDWSEPTNIEINGPYLEISKIKGGLFSVSAEIKNIGEGYASDIKRSISISGGKNNDIFIITNSSIDTLLADDITVAKTDKPVFGFGNVNITAAVSAPGFDKITKKANGFVLFCYVIIFD